MIVITVARKPLPVGGTVAKNAMVYGTGGLNIDASRITTTEVVTNHSRSTDSAISKGIYGDSRGQETHQTAGQKLGRWPANLILSHLEGCQQTGTKDIPASPPTPSGMDRMNAALAVQGYRPGAYQKGAPTPPSDRRNPDGTETVPVWHCSEGCPVGALDEQSGDRPSTLTGRAPAGGVFHNPGKSDPTVSMFGVCGGGGGVYADSGGASRFFKVLNP